MMKDIEDRERLAREVIAFADTITAHELARPLAAAGGRS
jgi:hypothetical protein